MYVYINCILCIQYIYYNPVLHPTVLKTTVFSIYIRVTVQCILYIPVVSYSAEDHCILRILYVWVYTDPEQGLSVVLLPEPATRVAQLEKRVFNKIYIFFTFFFVVIYLSRLCLCFS